MVGPTQRRLLTKWMIAEKKISQRKACRWVGLSRNALVEPTVIKEQDKDLQARIKALAKRYKHWGLLKIYRKLRKQGEIANHKRQGRLCGQTIIPTSWPSSTA